MDIGDAGISHRGCAVARMGHDGNVGIGKHAVHVGIVGQHVDLNSSALIYRCFIVHGHRYRNIHGQFIFGRVDSHIAGPVGGGSEDVIDPVGQGWIDGACR